MSIRTLSPFAQIVSPDGKQTQLLVEFFRDLRVLEPVALANLPKAVLGRMVIVLDATGGPAPCYGDGTVFRRLRDDTVVS